MRLSQPTLFDRLVPAKSVLLAGAGGGVLEAFRARRKAKPWQSIPV